ncbi:S8 family serine peptidase [Allostreptomyces psammosilenae]|uniref:Subtilisin family serine protease n=1 Tax=Allostreptomyces psammosilenae TaxID=1892865 RepID=A0A852ZP28_9ACTN|nr:S8 family serine peptidase [Allostreptomyces psammosilenae]NYI03207.1 subtilisin family serine protease [Allostreptomyces psammosilenae]
MTHDSRARARLRRAVVAAGLITGLAATSVPGTAYATTPLVTTADQTPGAADDKLGGHDADLLATAKAEGHDAVTLLLATAPGRADAVADRLDATGASTGRLEDELGYLRVTVPTERADAAIAEAQESRDVVAIDLNESIPLPDPSPVEGEPASGAPSGQGDGAGGADAGDLPTPGTPHLVPDTTPPGDAAADGAAERPGRRPAERGTAERTYPGPDARTGPANPYMPIQDTGAAQFVRDNPRWDGRGVTIGILDSGVDLAHPALQETTTGERKIVDWVTATDPLTDGDGTWLPMLDEVRGPAFEYAGRAFRAPAGAYRIHTFAEAETTGGDMYGDLNRDGDSIDSWAVLYDPATGEVRVDLDDDADFTDEEAMLPYAERQQVGYFGTDDPTTDIAEAVSFVVEHRTDVDLSPVGEEWAGRTADFVNIGVVESAHGTHVAGITAANGMFGGAMTGAAPGARIVSSRACSWSGGCTAVALSEGMIDLVANRGVDVVNMSIGSLPALNDANSTRARLYDRLIDEYGVQMFLSAGNSGPGLNTVGAPSVASRVVSVGASVSRETWAANYGAAVSARQGMFPFSSTGPREDGGDKPTLAAPGAAISPVPVWQPGQPIAEAGYALPPGYGMFNGTSMAAPQATGGAALLLSAARARGVDVTPATLRTALTSSARLIDGYQVYQQGAGLMNVPAAWKVLRDGRVASGGYTVSAPVTTALADQLLTPGLGAGIYDRGTPAEGGPVAGRAKTYQVTITRTGGAAGAVRHELSWAGNDGTFSTVRSLRLPLGEPVTFTVTARGGVGAHSALLRVDDPATRGYDHQMMATVLVSTPLATETGYRSTGTGRVDRGQVDSYFVSVPEGATALQVNLSGLGEGSQTRFTLVNPYGLPADTVELAYCYTNHYNAPELCDADSRAIPDPMPGVWEVTVDARRTSPLLSNPYTVTTSVFGAEFEPAVRTIPSPAVGEPTAVEWNVHNRFAGLTGSLRGGDLGSSAQARPTIATGESVTTEVTVPEGASSAAFTIGGAADPQADLDLYVYLDGGLIGSSADGDSEESVSIPYPPAGRYTVVVQGYSVPAGSTAYDYLDVYHSPLLGGVTVDGGEVRLDSGATSPVTAQVTVAGPAPADRTFFGEVDLVEASGSVVGTARVEITGATG